VCYVPRKPKLTHQIRRLREIVGKSQRDFARMIGLAVSSLQRIELGTLKLSLAVAWRIRAVTDVDIECLTRVGRPIKHASGEDYTREHFERAQWRFRSRAMGHECEYVIAELCDRIGILLRAAVSRRRFPLVASDLWAAIDKLRKAYALERLTNELLDRKLQDQAREQWRNIAPPGKNVFFDDDGHQLFSESDKMGFITSRLSIGSGSIAYGLGNDPFIIEIAHSGSNPTSGCAEKKLLTEGRVARPRSKQSSRRCRNEE
jgi:DNA-binding XRE family transcriptional regulator